MKHLLIYGGSFDPIHYGHLNSAVAVQRVFSFDRFIFLPCKKPVLKEPTTASSEHRAKMIELALRPYPQFSLDLREMNRNTPSYMSETLESFRKELGESVAMTLLLGIDAFMQLPQWHCWQKILNLAHLLVIQRPQNKPQNITHELEEILLSHETHLQNDLLTIPKGKIFNFSAGSYDISSSELRQRLQTNQGANDFLPDAVHEYILSHRLYQAETE